MNEILLSILIPTVVGREKELDGLLDSLRGGVAWEEVDYIDNDVSMRYMQCLSLPLEILTMKDDKTMTIGSKREDLYINATGLYALQIDDDDAIAKDAIELILETIKQNPDCVTYKESCMMDGVYKRSNHSLIYEKWQDNFDGYDYVRCPFYKDVIRTEIAKSVPFEAIRYNEDERWSMALRPHLKNEIHIDREIYFYQYTSTEHNSRYGITGQ